MWGDCLIAWKSLLQKQVQIGTHGAELVALIKAIQMALFVRRLIRSAGIYVKKVKLGCDQEKVVKGVRDGSIVASEAVKYQDLPIHWVLQHCDKEEGIIDLKWISTEINIADVLTKVMEGEDV